MEFRENVKRLRQLRGLTLGQLGELAGGLTPTQVKEIEDGKNANPSLVTLRKLAAGLGVPTSELMGDGGQEVPEVDSPRPEETVDVPLRAVSSGGSGIESEELGESYSLLKHLHGPGRFVVRIYGDSMWPNYWSGDLLLVEPKKRVSDHKVAIVKVGTETMIKRVVRGRGKYMLLADNPGGAPGFPKEIDAGNIEILGEVLRIVEGRRP